MSVSYIKTLLGFMTHDQRKSFVETNGKEGWISTFGISVLAGIPSFFVASARGFVENGDDAMKEVGHDGAKIPLSDPWRR